MNQVDSNASLDRIAALLDPYLKTLAVITNGELKDRITDKLFKPLLENNKTEATVSSDEEEMARKERHHRHVDGGKLPPKTQKELNEIVNRKYIFSGFNILIYA